jgi:hypothetical protein
MLKSRVVPLALAAAALAALACLWSAWCEFPIFPWNDHRLAPAFALRHGINPYPLIGGGPLFTWIYGPVALFFNLPATFAETAKTAIQTACLINAVIVLGPLAIIFFGSAELRARGFATSALALALATLLVPRPNLLLHVADQSAVALGMLSCWALARHPSPRQPHLIAGAVLCALAVWSKQIALFLLPAQILFLLLTSSRATALRYACWVALFGLAALAIFTALFGFQNLWLNLVTIPNRLPWAEVAPRLFLRAWRLIAQILVPAIGLVVLWRKGLWPSRASESGRFFHISVLVAIVMLPIGLVGLFKIGGDTNLLHSWNYLLPAFLLAWLSRDRPATASANFRVIAVTSFAILLNATSLTSLPARPFTHHLDAVTQLTAKHPHRLWFPQNPVVGFYADGTLWHSEDGVLTRNMAGYGIRESHFRRHLPPDLQGVVYPAEVDSSPIMSLLSEHNMKVRVPYWTMHTRTQRAATSP